MSSRSTLPSTLRPYLRLPPEASLILLTSTLGTSTTWLTSRFVSTLLSSPGESDEHNAVVLVSWLRDEKFWRNDIRRGTGLDTTKLSSSGHLAFIDGSAALTKASRTPKPDGRLDQMETVISTAIDSVAAQASRNVILILDAPDVLLATAVTSSSALNIFLLRLRSKAHSTVLAVSSDLPLVAAAALQSSQLQPFAQPTPLELSTATFLTQQAHAARFVMSVRELDTGAARDVSGVLRVTRGGEVDADENERETRELEALFLVSRDGVVKVFEKGSVV